MENLTVETFKEKVFDYTQNEEWAFKGDKPVIIDFYADWCAPCKTLAPILEELNAEYEDMEVYKINTEEQQELAAVFGIQSIPTLLFVPLEGQPQMAMGALPKDVFKKAIKEVLGLDDPAVGDAEEIKPEETPE
jgi:thioredoxin 1